MAKFTKSVQVSLTPEMFAKIRAEAERHNVSVSALIRDAIQHRHDMEAVRFAIDLVPRRKSSVSLLDTPLVPPTESLQLADEVMRVFREEDR